MNKDRIVIETANLLSATCAEIQPYLGVFWTNPDSLVGVSLVLISAHLKGCEQCQEKFARIMEIETPAWQK